MGPSQALEWDGTRLWRHLTTWPGGAYPLETWERLAPPASAAWTWLRKALERVDAWHWPKDSQNPLITDGGHWSLKLRWGQQRWSGRGCNEFPPGFAKVESHLQRMLALPALPGFPEAFRFRETRGGETWEFTWDGKVFQWSHVPGGDKPRTHGKVLGLAAETWIDFMEACHPHLPIEMSFESGAYAGIEFAIYFPESLGKLPPRTVPGHGFIDPRAAIEALKRLAHRSREQVDFS